MMDNLSLTELQDWRSKVRAAVRVEQGSGQLKLRHSAASHPPLLLLFSTPVRINFNVL